MATCKTLRADLKRLIKTQAAALAKVRALNAEVVTATKALPDQWDERESAKAKRMAVIPLVERAQKASDEFFRINSDLVNKREMVATTCDTKPPRKRRAR